MGISFRWKCLQDGLGRHSSHPDYRATCRSDYPPSIAWGKCDEHLHPIKSIPLQKIMQLDMYECITNEKNALRMLDHNFILKQVKTLKNSDNIFFLNEYIKGKNLNDILKEIITLNKSQAQFFSASIILSIEYMHINKWIHRDIKPENIMIS